MRLYKDYDKEPFSFLLNDINKLYHQVIRQDLGRTYCKMSVSEKIKTIDNKIKQNKVQFDLDRQTAKVSALWSGYVGKYEFLTGKDLIQEQDLLEKGATIKRFEYLSLGSEFTNWLANWKANWCSKKQYNGLNKVHRFDTGDDEIIIKKTTLQKQKESDLLATTIYLILTNIMIWINLIACFENKKLTSFHQDLNKRSSLKSPKPYTKVGKVVKFNNAPEFF